MGQARPGFPSEYRTPGNYLLFILSILILPTVRNFQKAAIAFLPDKHGRLFIFLILIAFFGVKALNYGACGITVTIGTSIQFFPNATYFHIASRFVDISPAILVSNFASLAPGVPKFSAGPAVCAATSDFQNRHFSPS